MKKSNGIIVILLCLLAFSLLVVGCGGDKKPGSATDAVSNKAEVTSAPKDVSGSPLDQYIELSSVTKTFRERYGSGASLGDYIVFVSSVQNKGTKDIDSVSGVMTIRDRSGKEIQAFVVKNNKEIRSGQSQMIHTFLKYDGSNDAHVRMKTIEIGDLKTEWKPKEIVFSDGTKIDASGMVSQLSGLDIEIPDKQNIAPPMFLKIAKGKNGVVNLYASPAASAAVIGTIKENTEFKGLNQKNGYFFVNRKEIKGWVRRENTVDAVGN